MKLDHLIEHNLGIMVKQISAISILFRLLPTLLQSRATHDSYQHFLQSPPGDLSEELEITRQKRVRATGA